LSGHWLAVTAGPEETRALGRRLGQLARPGLVVLLAGELGAGKTCFAQGVADGLGVPADNPVTSPSYTLLNIHRGRLPLYHFDLYRLATVDDLEDLGYDELAESDGVTLVEWADRLSSLLPASLRVVLTRLDEARRELRFEATDDAGRQLAAALANPANTL
jgi:tRNA threonylcarbamoyladenosine biosynthesis protein TsaE